MISRALSCPLNLGGISLAYFASGWGAGVGGWDWVSDLRVCSVQGRSVCVGVFWEGLMGPGLYIVVPDVQETNWPGEGVCPEHGTTQTAAEK